jgi:hypothetical protein
MSGEPYSEFLGALSRKRARDGDDEHHDCGTKRQLASLFSDENVVRIPMLPWCDWVAPDAVVSDILRVLEEHPYIPECAELDSDSEEGAEQSPPMDRHECRQLRHRCWSALLGNTNAITLSGTHEDLKPEISAILLAMVKYSSNALLIACGCHDLVLMAPEHPMTAHQEWARWIQDYDGIRTVLNAMENFMDNYDVQDVVTRLIYLLVMPGLCTRQLLIQETPTSTLLRVLQLHESKEDLCCDIGWTLCSLLNDKNNRKAFVRAQGIEHFIHIMDYHFDVGRIQEPCLLALIDVFQCHESARIQFLASGGAEMLTRTLERFGNRDDLVHAVIAVLFKLYHDLTELPALQNLIQGVGQVLDNDKLRSKVQQNAMHWLFHASEIPHWRSALLASDEVMLSILTATSETRPARVRDHGLFLLLDIALEPTCQSLILDHGGIENIMALPNVCRELKLEDPHFWQMLQRRMGNFLLAVDAETDDFTKNSFQGGTQAVVDVLQCIMQAPSPSSS